VEVTYQANREPEIRAWLAGHRWDYVVTSVHLVDYLDGWANISEAESAQAYYATHSAHQAYPPYFAELLLAAQSGLGNVLGHFDLVKRFGSATFGPFEPALFEGEIRAVLSAAVDRGVGLEINTSGLRQVPGEAYPGLTVLRWYRQMGGEILTVGSDAHHADHLGAGLSEAVDLACAAGFGAITVFAGQRPQWLDLPQAG
jgi:histidinol-phosphatase (PHP family)